MDDLDPVAGLSQALTDFLADHYRTMLAASATEGDGQITFSFSDVMRQQVHQQFGDSFYEFPGLGKRPDVSGDFGIASGEWTEFGHEMWIGQKPDIEQQVGVLGHSMFEAEADAGDHKVFVRLVLLKTLGDVGAQFVNIKAGGVDDEIGYGANGTQVAALCGE
jgi:hypothetical protein